MPEWLSILPPVLAIVIAIWKKEVIFALVMGIWIAESLLLIKTGALVMPDGAMGALTFLAAFIGEGFLGMMTRIVGVFESAGNTRVLLFGLIVGALLELMRDSGGVSAFVQRLTNMGLTRTPRQAGLLATITGTAVFVESSMSVLSAGVVSQRLFDKFGMSRARLAFIIDATSAPICILIMLNAWGAYVLQLISDYGIVNPTSVVIATIPFNFYPLLVLALVWYTVITTKVHGPMRKAEEAAAEKALEMTEEDVDPSRARYMLAPLATLIAGMLFFMFYTGGGDFTKGSGSTSVLLSVTLATILAIILTVKDKVYTYRKSIDVVYTGMGKLIPVSMVMLLAFAIGTSCKTLGTGPFVAHLIGGFLPAILVAPLLFIAGAIISFTTGTSWGTFAILIPLGLPLGQELGLPTAFVLSAVLGGGVFGDHCSPISDTTILSSLASGCDHLEHVRTQLPYALTAGTGAILLYMVTYLFV